MQAAVGGHQRQEKRWSRSSDIMQAGRQAGRQAGGRAGREYADRNLWQSLFLELKVNNDIASTGLFGFTDYGNGYVLPRGRGSDTAAGKTTMQ